ncbi:MAG: 3-hydroxyacyl-CoA dehydrogenase family protein, partial [Solirubrobacterales bacterium]|nr:3-hydroxyacyl-CoA dehydrogenase family protein [Solirubrobacterales bacterium]
MDEQVGIAGSGAIATGLAVCATLVGEPILWARSEASAERARTKITMTCGRLGPEYHGDRVQVVTDVSALSSATFLVEAIAEDLALKQELLGQLGEVAGPEAIISTTTSSLSVADLAAASGRPEQFVGLHVFNPVPKMQLVELAYPEQATAQTRERTAALCVALGKEAVEVPDVPGFVVNRLLFPYLFSAVEFMQRTGLEPAAVDTCMQLGAAHPMGPIALLDYIGLDVCVAIGDAIEADVPQSLRELCEQGALGRKAGRGLYPAETYTIR